MVQEIKRKIRSIGFAEAGIVQTFIFFFFGACHAIFHFFLLTTASALIVFSVSTPFNSVLFWDVLFAAFIIYTIWQSAGFLSSCYKNKTK